MIFITPLIIYLFKEYAYHNIKFDIEDDYCYFGYEVIKYLKILRIIIRFNCNLFDME